MHSVVSLNFWSSSSTSHVLKSTSRRLVYMQCGGWTQRFKHLCQLPCRLATTSAPSFCRATSRQSRYEIKWEAAWVTDAMGLVGRGVWTRSEWSPRLRPATYWLCGFEQVPQSLQFSIICLSNERMYLTRSSCECWVTRLDKLSPAEEGTWGIELGKQETKSRCSRIRLNTKQRTEASGGAKLPEGLQPETLLKLLLF